jgi:hypothetical protein
MRRVDEAHLPRLGKRVVPRPLVADDTADHPEGAGANRGRAVNEDRPVRRVVGDLEELVGLLGLRLTIDDGDVEVLEAGGGDRLALLVGAMLGRRAQVEDRLDAVRLERREVIRARLPARAELRVDLHEGADVGRRRLLRRLTHGREQDDDRGEVLEDHVRFYGPLLIRNTRSSPARAAPRPSVLLVPT